MIAKSRKLKSPAQPDTQCLTPGCTNRLVSRGLCPSCYISARRIVRDKESTWEQLEAIGLVAPARRASIGKFRVAFLAAKSHSK